MKKQFSVRTIIFAGSLLLQLNTLCIQSRGAAGDVDLSFDPGSGVNGPVNAIAVQPDGKVIIAGDFTTVRGLARYKVARLNADSSGDPSFNPGTAIDASGYVGAVALQSDGKVLIAVFTASYEGYIARLNSDGTLDNSFNPVTDAPVFSVAPQPDGKVLIGGGFTTVNGTNRRGIARLNSDGGLDTSFDPGAGANDSVRSITLQPDGKVLIAGYFFAVNGTNRNGIARLNANGTLDGSFDPLTSVPISSVAVQPDGKVLIGGYFLSVNGTNRNGIARLNANGSLDSSFNAGTGADSAVTSIALQPDGKVFIVGWFNDVPRTRRIARLNADGSLDSNFDWGAVVKDGGIGPIAALADGKVLIGGEFFTVNEVQRSSIARLNADGSLDGSFQPGKRMDISFSRLIALPDGKVLIGDTFTFVLGTNQYGSVRLNANGSLDGTFICATNFRPDLGVIAGVNDAVVTATVGQPNGKVVVAGYYVEQVCDSDSCITYYTAFRDRFNADGSRDTNFQRSVGGTIPWNVLYVQALAVQPDGKLLLGSNFDPFNGGIGIGRLNANGTLDTSFDPGTSPDRDVRSVVVQPDGKVLIGGLLQNSIARLNANGSLDGGFNAGANGTVLAIALQPDGKVIIGGSFTMVNGANRTNIARLNSNGSLDSSFNPGTGANGTVLSLALQPDGNVLLGGDFTTVNSVVRPHVARLYGDSFAPSLSIARSNASVIVSWPVTGLNFQLQESTNLSLPNSWSSVAQAAVTNGAQISVTVPASAGRMFFRLKSQ